MNYREQLKKSLTSEDNTLRIIDGNEAHDQYDISRTVGRYIHYIDKLGLGECDKVALKGERSFDWICFFFALQLRGVVPLLLDKTLDQDIFESSLKDYKFIFSNELSTQSDALPRSQDLPADYVDIGSLEVSSNPDLFSCHTSGTTGLPKIVTYDDTNMTWTIAQYKNIYKLGPHRVVIFALPFHYCYSIIPCCISPLMAGSTIVVAPEGTSAEGIVSSIDAHKVNILAVVPSIYHDMLRLDLSSYDLSSLELCDSGGESIPRSIVDIFLQEAHALITEGYGLTETSSLTHFLLPDAQGQIRLGSVGKALPEVECKIVDADRQEVNLGDIGELLIMGPMVVKEYENVDDASAFSDGWFATGDLFYMDDEGFYYLTSRKKDVGDAPVELARLAHTSIPQLLDIESVDEVIHVFTGRAQLDIFVVPADGVTDDLAQVVAASLPVELQEIAHVHLVGKLPRTATGKVIRSQL